MQIEIKYYSLVNHDSTYLNFLALQCALTDLSILLVKVGDELWNIMASIRLRRNNQSTAYRISNYLTFHKNTYLLAALVFGELFALKQQL